MADNRGPWIIVLAILLTAPLLPACSAETAVPGPEPSPVDTALPSVHGPPPKAKPYDSLTEIAAAFDCTKLEDLGNGGNVGLRTQGVCYVGFHNVDIYLTSDREPWERIAEQFPSVFGPQWIVVTPTGEGAARYVQSKIGGRLALPASSAT